MKKLMFLLFILVFTLSLSAKDVHAGFKLDFNSGLPFQANGTAGFILRHKVTEYFYFDNVIDAGYTMMYSSSIYDQGMIFSHTFYPTFRFGKGRAFFTFSSPAPTFKIIPFVHRYFWRETEYYKWSRQSIELFDQIYFGISHRISFEIKINDLITFSPISLNADLLLNLVASFLPGNDIALSAKFMGGLGSYILIRFK
ncbi:MAG: hypothetical protein A2015_09655 [Spirochaetes bacterium GWF1_31_7]|nr:MAG: hypothetical protein A2Y30_04520 [Spirochaetes bacterium GWE1_32_154]OHD47551.1 MAG: hypothetical protein A2015_09655 [Spirochaetes bacterium GWF1_31_7]OHD52041.1 MAG: hypothetical protein A2Y29_17415 [Spirochaetes bacterium GWE2_31_10]OHD83309.1 MAG: hypothetical protein A2355_05915 [Spirochaetes bacterium RIFOXYB1_FULL_32_8]HBD93460.1 hypothetical protein [Spirochaetia bacterium]